MNLAILSNPLSRIFFSFLILGLPSGSLAQQDEFLDDDEGGAVWVVDESTSRAMEEERAHQEPYGTFLQDAEERPAALPDQAYAPETDVDMPQEQPPFEGEVDTAIFFEALAPYGDWMWTPEHGWVWKPTGMEPDWRPYTQGRWVYSTHGWTWVSHFPWGWAPFHYGRWSWMESSGWVWVPGSVWGPGWVMWRYSDDYIGWSPLLAGYDWYYGWAYYPVHYPHWVFVGWRHFHHHNCHRHYLPSHRARDVFRHTYFPRGCRDASSGVCQRGPNHRLVTRHSGLPVERVQVRDLSTVPRRGSKLETGGAGLRGNELTIYRPRAAQRTAPGLSESRPGLRPGAGRQIRPSDAARPSRPRTVDLGVLPNSAGRRPSPGADIQPDRPSTVRPGRPVENRMPKPIVTAPGRHPAAGSSRSPGFAPSAGPSRSPGLAPSAGPSRSPGLAPSAGPSRSPGLAPSAGSRSPSRSPGLAPSASPRSPSRSPGLAPSAGSRPSASPAVRPSGGSSSSGSKSSGSSSRSSSSSSGGGSKSSSSSSSSGGSKRR